MLLRRLLQTTRNYTKQLHLWWNITQFQGSIDNSVDWSEIWQMFFNFKKCKHDLNCLLVTRQTDSHQGEGDQSLALTREVNLANPSSAPSAEEIREYSNPEKLHL